MSEASPVERQMLELINDERTSRGLNPLQLELRLNDSAEDHSDWMLEQDVFSHTGAGDSSAGYRMQQAGFEFSGSWAWAENIAWQSERGAPGISDDVENLHASLMNSPGHRANILNPNVTVIGIGVEQGDFNGWDAVMVTQNFAKTSASLQLDDGSGNGNGDPEPSSTPTSGADNLVISSAGTLKGLGGNDTITGSSGNDKLKGGGGNDTVSGGGGNDSIFGGGSKDSLSGGNGNDKMYGGNGNDTIDGQAGDDRLKGNDGSDVFVFSGGDDIVKDFDEFNSAEDIDLYLAAGISSYNDLLANHMSQEGAHVLIEDAVGDSMLIKYVQISDLDASDFLF